MKTDTFDVKISCEFASDKKPHVAPKGYYFCNIQVLSDAVFAKLTPQTTGNSIIGANIPAGTILPIKAKTFTLSTGAVIAQKEADDGVH
jgi:hypothetical protein